MVKSEPTWLRPEELKFEAESYLFGINMDRKTPKRSLQMEMFTYFRRF